MKEPDLELEGWRQQWNAHETVPPDLANAVEAGTRSLRRGIIAEIVVTIVMGGGALGWAIVSRRPDVIVLATAVWLFIAIAWIASMLLRRGAWQPVAATTTAFVPRRTASFVPRTEVTATIVATGSSLTPVDSGP